MCAARCAGVCLRVRVCMSMPVAYDYKCVCLPETARVWGAEQTAKSSAAPQSLRTRCSSLLAAMKSNQSPAFSPGLTSAFNYRPQQRQQCRKKKKKRQPTLGHSQHVTTQTQGWGRRSRPLHTVACHVHSVLKHIVGPDGLSMLLHKLGQSQGGPIL